MVAQIVIYLKKIDSVWMTENSYLPKKLHLQKNTLNVLQGSDFRPVVRCLDFAFEFSDVFQRSYFRPVVRRLDTEIDRHSFCGTFVASSTFVDGIFINPSTSEAVVFSTATSIGHSKYLYSQTRCLPEAVIAKSVNFQGRSKYC